MSDKRQLKYIAFLCYYEKEVKIMNIQYLPLKDLKPYEKNPRKTDKAVDYVANSIKEFGFKVPIVIDRNKVIVAGHVRFRAAKKLKLDEVPVIVADDLTEEQANAFRLIDNKTQELSTWNFTKLIDELDELTDEFNMQMMGFNERRSRTQSEAGDDGSGQVLDEGEELDLADFDDEQFSCTCPSCGFRFND